MFRRVSSSFGLTVLLLSSSSWAPGVWCGVAAVENLISPMFEMFSCMGGCKLAGRSAVQLQFCGASAAQMRLGIPFKDTLDCQRIATAEDCVNSKKTRNGFDCDWLVHPSKYTAQFGAGSCIVSDIKKRPSTPLGLAHLFDAFSSIEVPHIEEDDKTRRYDDEAAAAHGGNNNNINNNNINNNINNNNIDQGDSGSGGSGVVVRLGTTAYGGEEEQPSQRRPRADPTPPAAKVMVPSSSSPFIALQYERGECALHSWNKTSCESATTSTNKECAWCNGLDKNKFEFPDGLLTTLCVVKGFKPDNCKYYKLKTKPCPGVLAARA